MINKFKIGSVVECVASTDYKPYPGYAIKKGEQFIVLGYNRLGNVLIEGRPNAGYFEYRFKQVLGSQVKGIQIKKTFLDEMKKNQLRGSTADIVIPDNSGANGNYYRCTVLSKTTLDDRGSFDVEANDIIETLEMNFAEANALKAVWRKAAARLGNGKANHSPLYDAQKVKWSGERLVAQES